MKKLSLLLMGFLVSSICCGQIWTGMVDNNWTNPQNWNPNGIPNARIEIPITHNSPQISSEVPNIQSITIREGASLNITTSGVLQIMNEQTSIGLENKGMIQNMGSIIVKDAASFGISNDGILVNNGSIETDNVGMYGLFNFEELTNNGQIHVVNSRNVGIENIGVFENTATIQIEEVDSMGLRNYLTLNNNGSIDILNAGTLGLQNVGSMNNQGTLNITAAGKEGMSNHQTFTNYGTVNIESPTRAGIINYSNIINHSLWNISSAGLQGIMNYVSFINHGTLDIQNINKNGIENLTYFENYGTVQIYDCKNVGIFNAATVINHHILNIEKSVTAGVWSQVKFENFGEMKVHNTTWSGIANLGIFTNYQHLEITETFNRGIENQSTFTNEKCAVIRIEDSVVNGLNSDIINWGFIQTSFEGANWNQSNITNHGVIEDLYDSFGTQPVNNIGMIVSPIQICHDKTLGYAIQKGEAPNLNASEIWYSNEAQTLSAGFYTQSENKYATVLPLGDHSLYFEISDLQNACTFAVQAKLNVAENPSIEVLTEDVSCFGGNNGSISIAASGGSNEYDYVWNNENLSSDIEVELPADDYEVTVVDVASNCSVSQIIAIEEPPIISTHFEQLQWAAAPPMDKHQFSLEVMGGVMPYQYELVTEAEETAINITELNNQQLQIDASPLSTWTLEITDQHDCSYQFDLGSGGDDNINLPVIQTTLTINETDLGESDGSIEITVAEGDTSCGDYTYVWTNGGNTAEIDLLFAGGYTVIVSDCEGNTTSAYIELERDGEKGSNRKAMKIFPNPAVDWTNLRFISENVDNVSLQLFNTNKQLIRTIYEGEMEGEIMYEMILDLQGLPSGVYYVHLTTPDGISIAERIMTIK